MLDIEVTDQLNQPVPGIKIDLAHPSSLLSYLKTELLHLAVLPDFEKVKDQLLSKVSPKPISFEAKAADGFSLGHLKPELEITPGAGVKLRVNTNAGSNLFQSDPFHVPAQVPAATGYVSAAFTGSLKLGSSGSDGDLTFGFSQTSGVTLESLKAFPLGTGEPSLAQALAKTLSSFTIPATLADLDRLTPNDIATVSGEGSLKVSGGVKVASSPNPLASVDLPLGIGPIEILAGATVGFSAGFTISGAYQVRARRKNADTIQLSFSPKKGTLLQVDLSTSVGVTATVAGTDLLADLLGLISADPVKEHQALADLPPVQRDAITDALKDGVNHRLKASLDLVLSTLTEDQAAFQYEIQPAKLTPEAVVALNQALKGDLTRLTSLDEHLPPGITLLKSVLSQTRNQGATLKLNLIGILNYTSVAELLRKSEIFTDFTTGDVTIKEIVTGNRITALVDPLERAEALRKVLFNSVLITTSYRAGKVVSLPEFACEQTHFAFNQNTRPQTLRDYLNWYIALHLLTSQDATTLPPQTASIRGRSTCILRTSFGDSDCDRMFFDLDGRLHPLSHYQDIGRRALQAILDPKDNPNDQLRATLLDDAHWPQATSIGASNELGTLLKLRADDPRLVYLTGDIRDIDAWAKGMHEAGALIEDMRAFLANSHPVAEQFKQKRDHLQSKLAQTVQANKLRFEEPWGMVCLFEAAGAPKSAYAKISAPNFTLEKGSQLKAVAAT